MYLQNRKPAAAGLLHNITLNIMYQVKFSVSTRSFAAVPDIGALHRITETVFVNLHKDGNFWPDYG